MDQYVPLPGAAQQLGLSLLAARRRCQRGTLDAVKRDGEWYVRLTGTGQRDGPTTDQDGPTDRDVPMDQDRPADRYRPHTLAANGYVAEAVAATAATWQVQLDKERERANLAEQQAREMATAAAMWQERARNLEAELQHVLALPAHEEAPEPRRHWWAFWRQRTN